jgi:NTE family protein
MNYDTICLSGGGVKGFAFIGAIDYLENQKIINISSIENWVGTSAGALIGFLLSIGYTIDEVREFIINFNFKKLEPEPDINDILCNFGINNGKKFMFIIQELLYNKLDIKDITFKQHYEITKKNLIIIGTNFSKGNETVFNTLNNPNMSVLTALRISMAVPLIFTPILYESEYYVDGALVNNFPINHCNPETTLGIYIKNSCCNEMTDIMSLIHGCLAIISDTVSVKDCDKNNLNIIEIENNVHEFTSFDLDKEKKQKIIDMGQTQAKKFVDNLSKKISQNIFEEIINKI